MRRLVIAVLTLGVASLGVGANAGAQAVDDGPCPGGTISVASAGSDYSGGRWTLPDGTVFGTSAEEDECITPVHSTATVERYVGSDGVELAKFDAACTGVLVWSYDPGEFVCLSAYVPQAQPMELPQTR